MTIFRSIIFNIVFFTMMGVMLFLATPLRLFDKEYTFLFWRILSKMTAFISKAIAGIDYKIENAELITDAPAIYAMRHESTWETLVMIHKFKRPVFILKKELLDIPFFGGLSKKVGSISVNRTGGAKALINAAKEVASTLKQGHQIIIFPEGTRSASGEHTEIKRGIALFYKRNTYPVIPIVHNSGKFWGRHGFLKHSGVITVKILPPIPAGLSQDEFMEQLNSVFFNEIENLKNK